MTTRQQLNRILGEETSLPDWALEPLIEVEPECETCVAPLDTVGRCPIGCSGVGGS